MKIMIAEIIRQKRTEMGISQEALAERMGVTVQAVSKWENGLSCPDIAVVPDIADFFGVTVDYLLTGRENKASKAECGLPDDGRLRIVQAMGNKILGQNEFKSSLLIKLQMPKPDEQPDLNVDIWGKCSIEGDVNGGISCGDGVCCGNVGGSIQCGDGVNCGNVGGSIQCGDSIKCGHVGGDVTVEGDLHCDIIRGSVKKCEGDIYCERIKGE